MEHECQLQIIVYFTCDSQKSTTANHIQNTFSQKKGGQIKISDKSGPYPNGQAHKVISLYNDMEAHHYYVVKVGS